MSAQYELFFGSMFSILFFSVFLFFFIGLNKGLISISSVIMCANLLFDLTALAWNSANEYGEMIRNVGMIKRGFISIRECEQEDLQQGALPTKITWNIDFINSSYSKGGVDIFKDCNLSIKSRERIAIIGPIGIGKSTIFNLLTRAVAPNEKRSIFIDNFPIEEINTTYLRTQTAFVTQNTILFNCSLYENILFGNIDATQEEVEIAAKKAKLHDFVESLPERYMTPVGLNGSRFSGGQLQLICIARAILRLMKIQKNALILCDEPASSLDKKKEREIIKTIFDLTEEYSSTLLVITHSFSREVIEMFDKIVFLNKEKIEVGTPSYLMNNSLFYREMFNN